MVMATAVGEKLDLDAINPMLEKRTPEEIVEWAAAQFGDQLIMTSSFGEQAAVMIHMATRVIPDIKIITVDTGYLFPETYEFMESLRHRFNLNVWTFRTKNDPIAYLRHAGEDNPELRKDIDACCAVNKNEPMARAFKQIQPLAWLRGTRREQTDERKDFKFINWDKRYSAYGISPILNWTSKDVGQYMKKHDLPYNPLVEKGYLSIGCNPLSCTRNVMPGEDPRAGRWSGSAKTECGINVDNSLDSANL